MHSLNGGIDCLAGAFPLAHAAAYVLTYGHVGKKCILLEEIADATLLGGKVDLFFTVEECYAVQDDPALVRTLYTGYTFQSHALSASACTKKG